MWTLVRCECGAVYRVDIEREDGGFKVSLPPECPECGVKCPVVEPIGLEDASYYWCWDPKCEEGLLVN